jgi:hypothetical protein
MTMQNVKLNKQIIKNEQKMINYYLVPIIPI